MAKSYNSFAAYIEDVYYDDFHSRLKSYIYQNKGRMNLSSYSVPDPSYVKLDDFHVMGVTFHESENDRIDFQVTVQADIEISGRSRRDYDSDMVDRWFSISCSATLRNGLHNFRINGISEYSNERFKAEDALTKFLVPYVYAKDLDKHAEKFLEKYCPQALETPMPLPIKDIINNMGLTVFYAPLTDGIFGQTYFNTATVDTYTSLDKREVVSTVIQPGTILVNPDVFFMRNIGSRNNTIIHECVHWDKHYKFFELQKLLNPELQAISCAVVEDYRKKPNQLEDELSWMEWQANSIAPKILIPEKTGRPKLTEILQRLRRVYRGTIRDGYIMELAISEFADFFRVSTTAAKIRAFELGFERNNAIFESFFNSELIEDIHAGRIIHAGGMMVINDPKYVQTADGCEATLTDYALEHADECCLVFDRTTRVSTHYDDSFYRICFLCRDADSKSFVEATFNKNEGKNEDVLKRAREMATIAEEAKRVSDILAEVPSSFCGTLDYHIERRKYTNEKMEERSGISSRMIQDYRNRKDAKPTLQSVLALCIGLNLHPSFAYDLIAKAGYNIMTASEENLIYRYLIDHHHMETIYMWNEKLRDAGIPQHLPKNGNKLTEIEK